MLNKKYMIVLLAPAVILAGCGAPKKLASVQGVQTIKPQSAIVLKEPYNAKDIESYDYSQSSGVSHFDVYYRMVNDRKVISDGRYRGVPIPAGENKLNTFTRYYFHRRYTMMEGIPRSTTQEINFSFEAGKCYAPVMTLQYLSGKDKSCTHDVLSGKAVQCKRRKAYKVTNFVEVGDFLKGTYAKGYQEACDINK